MCTCMTLHGPHDTFHRSSCTRITPKNAFGKSQNLRILSKIVSLSQDWNVSIKQDWLWSINEILWSVLFLNRYLALLLSHIKGGETADSWYIPGLWKQLILWDRHQLLQKAAAPKASNLMFLSIYSFAPWLAPQQHCTENHFMHKGR